MPEEDIKKTSKRDEQASAAVPNERGQVAETAGATASSPKLDAKQSASSMDAPKPSESRSKRVERADVVNSTPQEAPAKTAALPTRADVDNSTMARRILQQERTITSTPSSAASEEAKDTMQTRSGSTVMSPAPAATREAQVKKAEEPTSIKDKWAETFKTHNIPDEERAAIMKAVKRQIRSSAGLARSKDPAKRELGEQRLSGLRNPSTRDWNIKTFSGREPGTIFARTTQSPRAADSSKQTFAMSRDRQTIMESVKEVASTPAAAEAQTPEATRASVDNATTSESREDFTTPDETSKETPTVSEMATVAGSTEGQVSALPREKEGGIASRMRKRYGEAAPKASAPRTRDEATAPDSLLTTSSIVQNFMSTMMRGSAGTPVPAAGRSKPATPTAPPVAPAASKPAVPAAAAAASAATTAVQAVQSGTGGVMDLDQFSKSDKEVSISGKADLFINGLPVGDMVLDLRSE